MKKLSLKYQLVIYLSLATICLSSLAFVYHFWKEGYLDEQRGERLSQISYQIAEMKKGNGLEALEKSIVTNQADKAKSDIDEEWKKIKEISVITKVGLSFELGNWKTKISEVINGLSNQPSSADLVQALKQPLHSFEKWTEAKNWKTLNKVAATASGQIDFNSHQSTNHSLKTLDKNIDWMEGIAKNSTLEAVDKQQIFEKLSAIKADVAKTRSLLKSKEGAVDLAREYSLLREKWLDEVSPAIENERSKTLHVGRKMALAMGIIAAGSLVLASLLIPVFKYFKSRDVIDFSRTTRAVIEEGILKGKNEYLVDLESTDQESLKNVSTYLQKRMGLSSLFQDTLPFSSLLLDRNLKLIWANKIFFETFKLNEEEIEKKLMSWDFVSQKTNIGDDDPVVEAIQKGNAGIFQIKIQGSEGENALPYEMYVRPVSQNDETYAMIYFYPLISLEDTINAQARTIVAPIEKTLLRLIDDTFDSQFQNNIIHDFELAKIGPIFDQFARLYEIHEIEKKELNQNIDQAIASGENATKTLSALTTMIEDLIGMGQQQIKTVTQLKDDIIHVTDVNNRYSTMSGEQTQMVGQLMSSINLMLSREAKLVSVLHDALDSLPEFEKIKVDFKASRQDLRDSKNKIAQGLKELYGLKRFIEDKGSQAQYEGYLDRLKNDMEFMEQSEVRLDKKLQNLEVMFSKMRIIFDGINSHLPELAKKNDKDFVAAMKEKEVYYTSSFEVLSEQSRQLEGSMVERLRGLYLLTKSQGQSVGQMKSISPSEVSLEKRSGQNSPTV